MVAVNFNVWGNGSINRAGTLDRQAPTYVLVHGYQSTGGNSRNNFTPADWMANIAQTLRLRESDANIVLVDWEDGASSLWYNTSAGRTPEVGRQIATFLQTNNLTPAFTTIIGHSLGAHIAGFAGSTFRQLTGQSLGQIVGLDPAGPSFEGKGPGDRLDPTDAARVTAIHTSATLGYDDPLATYDIYANWNDAFQPGQWNFAGNHSYAHTLYTELLQGYSFRQSSGALLNLNAAVNSQFTGRNDASTKNNRVAVALTLNGTGGNDALAGGIANDTVRGGAGNDYITGGDGNDSLFGESGHDRLYGGLGNDGVVGGTGNDILFGDLGNDTLIGADPLIGLGRGESDRLTGGPGRDVFVLGTAAGVFYNDGNPNTAGTADYALITDFNPAEDFLQLRGSRSSYQVGSSPAGLPTGVALFLREAVPELIAIVQGVNSLDLNASYFTTV